jgi:hypothetical protein
MGLGIDTIVGSALNPGASGGAATMNTGDSATVRNFNQTSRARMDFVSRQGTVAGFVEIKSPRFHDVSRGLHWIFNESPAVQLMPPQTGQPVYGADSLTINISGGTSETDGFAAGIYYFDIPGIAAILHSPAEIIAAIVNIKPIEVDVTQGASVFAWVDTALTTTENLLKANTYYAILGYTTDTAALAVGVKGPETGNLRICGPGSTSTFFTDQYFIYMSNLHQNPYIPVFNANNRANLFVSIAGLATGGTTKVVLNAAELAAGFTP